MELKLTLPPALTLPVQFSVRTGSIIGGSTYQVPIEVSGFRATNLALRWIIQYSRQRVGRSMSIKLANEIIDTANDIGNTIKKKEETHKMANANKAFAHFRY